MYLGAATWPSWEVQNPKLCTIICIHIVTVFSFLGGRSLYFNKSLWTDEIILSNFPYNNNHGEISIAEEYLSLFAPIKILPFLHVIITLSFPIHIHCFHLLIGTLFEFIP